MNRTRKKKIPNIRTNIIMAGFFIALFIIDIRLFSIQVLQHKKYEGLAEEQYWNAQRLPAQRGSIKTKDGYTLAGTQSHYLLFGEPKRVENIADLSHSLAEFFSVSRLTDCNENLEIECRTQEQLFSDYYQHFYDTLDQDLLWVPLMREVTPPEQEQLLELGLIGIGFEDEPIRYYPEGNLAAHVLGFVASNEKGEKTGYYGIEGSLNDDLKGRDGRITQETDATGTPILVGDYKKISPIQGRDVVLTINRSVQYIAEKKIKEGVQNYDAVSGTIIIMDPATGEVIAMANYPTYYPNDFNTVEEPLENAPHRKSIEKRNLAVQQIYEPGSVIKPLTVSAAIDLNLVSPETTFEDNGPVQYSDYVIDNWDGKHHSTQTIVQLLQKSNNIGAAWVGHQVGTDKLYKYFTNFGIGTRTGISLEGEDTGYMRSPKEWTDIDLATAAFGQGISATPLQVLNSFNSIANGGFLLEPKVIDKIIGEKKEIELPTKSIRRVISKETSETMVDMLEQAASGGEAKYFVLKNYRIAGKTGTAQIPEEGKYSPDRTNATFVGFMAGSRKFSMIVKLEEPKTSTYAAETAVPLWMEVTKELVKFYGLPPDKSLDSN